MFLSVLYKICVCVIFGIFSYANLSKQKTINSYKMCADYLTADDKTADDMTADDMTAD